MDFHFQNKRITGILTVLPSQIVTFEEEMTNYNFSPMKCQKLKLAMGYKEHRLAKKGECSSDFCIYGLQYLFDNNKLNRCTIICKSIS